jgi:hypothetical protein
MGRVQSASPTLNTLNMVASGKIIGMPSAYSYQRNQDPGPELEREKLACLICSYFIPSC